MSRPTPRPHQVEAVDAALAALRKSPRCQLHMTCGSGKTLTALWTAEKLGAKRIVVFAPSIALIRQILGTFRACAAWPKWSAIAVCSDATVAEQDDIATSDLECPVTTDRRAVMRWQRSARGTQVVLSTYSSASELKGLAFDFGVFDEAHKTSGRRGKSFSFALEDRNVKIAKRLFMTATPRVVTRRAERWDEVSSMDDLKVYGPVAYALPFRKAVDAGIVTDYKIIISEVVEQVNVDRHLSVQVAMQKAIQRYKAKKVFSFHNTIAAACTFAADRSGFNRGTGTFHIHGKQRAAVRSEIMDAFRQSPCAVVTNARCLSEGVDVPETDMVVFAEPRQGLVDITQAVGRACRKVPGKKFGYILLPLFRRAHEDEALSDAASRSRFAVAFGVLKALAEQDHVLADAIENASRAVVEGRELPELPNIEFAAGTTRASLAELRRAVTTAIAEVFSGKRNASAKKKALLTLAATGAPRPSHGTKLAHLARALDHYTQPSNNTVFDPIFTREIRQHAPSWFACSRTEAFKAELLQLARSGARRPRFACSGPFQAHSDTEVEETRRANRLSRYLQEDAQFAAQIQEAAPNWLVDLVGARKQQLLDMANAGRPKPTRQAHDPAVARMASQLRTYCSPSSTCYDPGLRAQLVALGWFERPSSADHTRKQLLEMARTGRPKPTRLNPDPAIARLAYRLHNYCSSSDAKNSEFRAQMETFGWLERAKPVAWSHGRTTTATFKQQLLEMARAGHLKPTHNDPSPRGAAWAERLQRYCRPSSGAFDPEFRAQMVALGWRRA